MVDLLKVPQNAFIHFNNLFSTSLMAVGTLSHLALLRVVCTCYPAYSWGRSHEEQGTGRFPFPESRYSGSASGGRAESRQALVRVWVLGGQAGHCGGA